MNCRGKGWTREKYSPLSVVSTKGETTVSDQKNGKVFIVEMAFGLDLEG